MFQLPLQLSLLAQGSSRSLRAYHLVSQAPTLLVTTPSSEASRSQRQMYLFHRLFYWQLPSCGLYRCLYPMRIDIILACVLVRSRTLARSREGNFHLHMFPRNHATGYTFIMLEAGLTSGADSPPFGKVHF